MAKKTVPEKATKATKSTTSTKASPPDPMPDPFSRAGIAEWFDRWPEMFSRRWTP